MSDAARRSPNVVWHPGELPRSQRWDALGVTGVTVWFTGLSGSGKSTIAAAVETALLADGRPTYLLDGDNLRHGLNGDLGFTADDRDENVRRASEVARLFADAGVVSLVPLISPYRAGRDRGLVSLYAGTTPQRAQETLDVSIDHAQSKPKVSNSRACAATLSGAPAAR